MMNIRLKEREEALLSALKASDTFKIPESSYIFMKIGVDGLTVRPIKHPNAEEDPKPIRVLVPEGKTIVLCVNTGNAQFLSLTEKVHIVELECVEVVKERQPVILKPTLGEDSSNLGGEGRADEVSSL